MKIVRYAFLRFTIFEIIFIFSPRNKNFQRRGCGKARLLLNDRVEAAVRSSRSQMPYKTGDVKYSCNNRKKTPVSESLFNKVGLNFFIKKRPQHRYFPVNIAKFLRTAFVTEHRLLFSS